MKSHFLNGWGNGTLCYLNEGSIPLPLLPGPTKPRKQLLSAFLILPRPHPKAQQLLVQALPLGVCGELISWSLRYEQLWEMGR